MNNKTRIPLNEFFSYGITRDTLHIHVIPKDVKNIVNKMGGYNNFINYVENQLDDAFIKIKPILINNNNIKKIFAVSPSIKIKKVQKLFIDRGFNVTLTTEPKFCKMFKVDSVWQAYISKNKFFRYN